MENYQEVLNLRDIIAKGYKDVKRFNAFKRQALKSNNYQPNKDTAILQNAIKDHTQSILEWQNQVLELQPKFTPEHGIQSIENKLEIFGYKCVDIQADDSSVGISDGWVVYEDEHDNLLELSYSDAEHYAYKQDFIVHSIPCTDA